MAKCLYSFRDYLPKTLFKTTAQVCKKSTSDWRASLKKKSLFKPLLIGVNVEIKETKPEKGLDYLSFAAYFFCSVLFLENLKWCYICF